MLKKGDILMSNANIICNQVNCMGFMNDGLAKRIKEVYPQVFDRYKRVCEAMHKNNESKRMLGKFQLIPISPNISICNIFGQYKFGTGQRFTNYDAVREALTDIKNCAELTQATIAIPYKLGCGCSGGKWDIMESIIIDIFADSSLTVEMWKRDHTNA